MAFTISRGNFTQLNVFSTGVDTSKCLAYNLWSDMIANGFSIVAMDNSSTNDQTLLNNTRFIILQPSTDIDPLWDTNKWYVAFNIINRSAFINTPNNSSTINTPTITTTQYPDTELQVMAFGWEQNSSAPTITSTVTNSVTTYSITGAPGIFVPVLPGLKYPNATSGDPTTGSVYPRIWNLQPYTYRLTIAKRGFVFSLYDQTLDNMNYNGIYCVQRGVDKTGTMRSDGQTPLYCVTNVISIRRFYDVETGGESLTTVPMNYDNVATNNHKLDLLTNALDAEQIILNQSPTQQGGVSAASAAWGTAPKIDFTRDVEQGPGPTSTWMGYTIREANDMIYQPTEDFFVGTKKFKWPQTHFEDGQGQILPQYQYKICDYERYYSNTTVFYDEFDYAMISTSLSYPNPYTGKYLHRFPSFWDAPVTADNGDYLLILPYGLCSERFSYTDEVDLISVSKADAYQESQQVPIMLYNDNRTYVALSSNETVANPNNHSGIRGFILINGSEFDVS